MARIKYTATFPAAPAGAEVTWPQTAEVFPDADSQRRVYEANIDSTNTVVVYSAADPLLLTCHGETLTMTAGSATQTGAAPAAPSAGTSPFDLDRKAA